MKVKTINAIISGKINDWLKSIECEQTRKLASKNTIVTGGCIASMLLNEDVNDYDIYFRNRETALAVANYYISRFDIKNKDDIACQIYIDETVTDRVKIIVKSSGVASEEDYQHFEGIGDDGRSETDYVTDLMSSVHGTEEQYDDLNEKAQEINDGEKYRAVFISSNAITLSHKIQLVLRFFGDPEQIHKNYDFVHCTNYWTSWENKITTSKDALEALLAKELRYVGSKYPLCSIMRIRKFIKRGWSINAGQILKAIMQLQELDLTVPAVLEDQLTGVDSAYFTQIIRLLKEKDDKKIDTAYLITIIDKMF